MEESKKISGYGISKPYFDATKLYFPDYSLLENLC